MSKYLLVLLLLYASLLNGEIIIRESESSFDDFVVNYFHDKTGTLTLEEIEDKSDFQKIDNTIALGKQEGNVWLHFSVKNETDETQERVLFITEPNIWDIELFIVSNKKVISTQSVGQNTFNKDGKIASLYPELEIDIEAEEKLDVYIRSSSPFHHTFKLAVTTHKDVVNYKIFKNSLLALYFGAIGALLLYNLFIYFSIRDKNYLLYIGFVFFYLVAQLQHNTPFNSLFSSLELSFSIASSHVFWVAFHTLFSVKLLNVQEYYPRLGKYLLYTGYFLLGLGFLGIYNLEVAIQIIHPFMIVLPFVLLFTAIALHRRKNRLAIFYIIAQTLFLTSSFIFGLLFAGVFEYNNFTRYIHLGGSLSEVILFSFALAYKTRLVMQENERQKEMISDYAKLTYIGETMVSIYHQWKSPVNNIYNYITHIETAKEFGDKNLESIINTNLAKIKENTNYLKETANEFLKINAIESSQKLKVNLREEIESVLKLLEEDCKSNEIIILGNYKKDYVFLTHRNQLRNLLMILVENAIKTFKNRNIKSPELTINTTADAEAITITIEDNAGGVVERPLEKVFQRYHSSSDSSGIGLYLAKYVLVENLKGEIGVQNSQNGAIFTIKIASS